MRPRESRETVAAGHQRRENPLPVAIPHDERSRGRP
jgi:hypothetical protein